MTTSVSKRVLASGVAVLALALATGGACAAADPKDLDPAIAAIVADLRPPAAADGSLAAPTTLAEEMARHHTPAVSIAVVDHGKLLWARAWGLADVAANRPATPDTLFQAASISKPVAAVAALQLVQEGKLTLDQDVNARLVSWRLPASRFTADKPVTLRHLLTHTGGLTVHGFPGYARGEPLPSVVQVLDGAKPANTPAVVSERAPGEVWNYSGGGITIAQLLMTDVTGQAFPELMRARVLGPAGMAASSYAQPAPADRLAVAATGYRTDGAEVPGKNHVYPEMAAAGLWTTPSDLARFVIALQQAADGRSTRLLSQATARAMLTPGLSDWGLGVMVKGEGEDQTFAHGGANAGFRANLIGYVHGGRGVVVMTNGDDGSTIAAEVSRAVARAFGWGGLEPQPAKK